MTEHALAPELRLYASDPVNWKWQIRDGGDWGYALTSPGPEVTRENWRLVFAPYYDEPGAWEWDARYQGNNWSDNWCGREPVWSHKHSEYRFRRKAKTLTLPERTIPMPMREAPEMGTEYWLVQPMKRDWVLFHAWQDDEFDRLWLELGLCYDNEEDAIAASKAMCPFGGEG